jgi:hypothetical protein
MNRPETQARIAGAIGSWIGGMVGLVLAAAFQAGLFANWIGRVPVPGDDVRYLRFWDVRFLFFGLGIIGGFGIGRAVARRYLRR